jgi:hypothetical protein
MTTTTTTATKMGHFSELQMRFIEVCNLFQGFDNYLTDNALKALDMIEYRRIINSTSLIYMGDPKVPETSKKILNRFLDYVNGPLTPIEIVTFSLSRIQRFQGATRKRLEFTGGKYVLVPSDFLFSIQSEYFQIFYSGRWLTKGPLKFDFHVVCGLLLKYMSRELEFPDCALIRSVIFKYGMTFESAVRQLVRFADVILWTDLKRALIYLLFKKGYCLTRDERIEIGTCTI